MCVILTGDRPTGKLHVGHYVGSLKQRVELQNKGDYDEMYVMIADAQALTDNFDNPKKIRNHILEVAMDYLSVGIDPNKCNIFIQSEVSELTELSFYYMNLVTVSRLQRNPTVKSEIKQKGFEKSIPVGFFCYPISQAADITAFKANLIPVGEDQEPMLEQTREIVRAFNKTYKTDCLVECKSVLAQTEASKRLPGTDGNAKMSKSLGNCIYLSDEPDVIKKKVNSIKTFPRNIDEPGIIENNIVFVYLDAFCRDEHFGMFYPEFKNLEELKTAYQKGGIGDGKIKGFLNSVIQYELKPIREKREELKNHIPEILKILKDGTDKANIVANNTLKEVKSAMCINYFEGEEFEKEQIQKFTNKKV